MGIIKGGHLIFIILLIGLNYLKADEDITEAISDTTDAITTQTSILSDNSEESPRNVEKKREMKNPTVQRLPADSETIRRNIIDSEFTCDEREPGFYADVENECQIFHRCLQGRSEVFSFICPETTRFDQRVLVCTRENEYGFDCTQSEQYYHESNRAFLGNLTAEETMNENIRNSQEIKNVEMLDHMSSPHIKEEIKLFEIIPTEELSIMNNEDKESIMIEKNSIDAVEQEEEEDEKEVESVSEEMEESNDYQAELIPSSTNHIDASIATSDISDSTTSEQFDVESIETPSAPQKVISLSVLDPIVEMMMPNDNLTHESVTTIRNIRKRSGSHRKRFLFKADAKQVE